MSRISRLVEAPPDDVWAVLADGWTYPSWVVGASRMRRVDPSWPQVGARLHHSVGTWPALLDDHTEVVEEQTHHVLRLDAHAWPAGRARVELTLMAQGSGTRVEIAEDVESGPGTLVPSLVRSPALAWRNTETLRRLAFLAERRG